MGQFSNLSIMVAVALAFAGELAAHYIPWARIVGRELHRVEAYIIGLSIIFVSYSVWAFATGNEAALWALLKVIVAAGLTVMGCYVLDYVLEQRDRANDNDEQVQLFERALRYYDGKADERRKGN